MVDGQRAAPLPSPLLGQHNHEILCGELGLSAQDLELLAAEGAV